MYWSKGFLLLLFLCCCFQRGKAALSKAALQQTNNMMKNVCKRSSGVSQDLLNQLKAGEFPEDHSLKCYIQCCLEMMKSMKKDKITVAEATKQAKALLPQELIEPTLRQLNECKDAVGTDACEVAYNFIKCSKEVEPKNMLIPT